MQRALLSMLNLLLLLTFEPNLLKLSPQFTITKQHSLLMTRNAHHLKNIFHSGDGSNPFSRVQLGGTPFCSNFQHGHDWGFAHSALICPVLNRKSPNLLYLQTKQVRNNISIRRS